MKITSKFIENVAGKAVAGASGGSAATAATLAQAGTVSATGGWVGSLATGAILGAGAGLVIGLVVHAATSYVQIRETERRSPFRFLSTLEDAGIGLRSGLAQRNG